MSKSFPLAVFTIVFAGVYILSFANGWTLFRYYPLSGEFTTQDLPVTAGPAMGWYAWIVQGFAAAAAAALVALALPARLAAKAGSATAWIGVLVILLYTVYIELHWFQAG